MTMFPSRPTSVLFVASSFVDGKMPKRKTIVREVTIYVCAKCDIELEYRYPRYTCPDCSDTYEFKV